MIQEVTTRGSLALFARAEAAAGGVPLDEVGLRWNSEGDDRRAVPNIRSERAAETRDFFVDLLGFEVAMDLGWVVTVASSSNPSAQVTIISNDDPARPVFRSGWTTSTRSTPTRWSGA